MPRPFQMFSSLTHLTPIAEDNKFSNKNYVSLVFYDILVKNNISKIGKSSLLEAESEASYKVGYRVSSRPASATETCFKNPKFKDAFNLNTQEPGAGDLCELRGSWSPQLGPG